MLTVYVDFKSPAAYLAVEPTLVLAAKHGVDVIWRPFETTARDIPIMSGKETVGESHRRVRAESQRAIHEKYAALRGLSLKFPEKPGNTTSALGALATLGTDQTAFVKAAFHAYWQDQADLDEFDVVRGILAQQGMTTDGLTVDKLRAAQAEAQAQAEEAGIVDAPGYIIDDQIFVGREHLPWIEEIIRAHA